VYRQATISVIELLVMRMLYALPFYAAMLAWQWKKFQREPAPYRRSSFFPRQLLLPTILMGLLGYYISSFFDFWGLKFISAGLERVVLFSYPTLVVLLSALLFRQKIYRYQLGALLLSYVGIAIAFAADLKQEAGSNVWLGGFLIFVCATTFSMYVIFSGRLIPQIGVGLFTAVAMLSATTGIVLHFLLTGHHLQQLLNFNWQTQVLMALMGVFATVVPSFFVSSGIKLIGSSNVAIISSIGPMITIALAWYFLQEPFGWQQLVGTLLVVAGVFWVSKKVSVKN
jgi:drug/metabolite transporter (DMT)-like permease